MKHQLKKAFVTAGLASSVLLAPGATPQEGRANPLLSPSTLPFGAPDFSVIRESDYLPAFKKAIELQRREISRIVNNKQKPTFVNTILAYERSGRTLDRVQSIFYGLTSAHKTPEIAKTQKIVTPLLTDFENELTFNDKFFQRVKYVYDHELNKLKGEDRKLLEEIYKNFVRSGALLPKDKKARMVAINKRMADLRQQW